jgi:hypothetical protein
LSSIKFLGFFYKYNILHLISKKTKKGEKNIIHKNLKHKKKKASTIRYNNFSLLKVYMRLFTGDSCGLPLEAKYFDGL